MLGRLDKLLGLIRLDTAGLADGNRYADLLAEAAEERSGGVDWVSARDLFGTCSIDDMIDASIRIKAIASVEKENRRARASRQRRTAEKVRELGAERVHLGRHSVTLTAASI